MKINSSIRLVNFYLLFLSLVFSSVTGLANSPEQSKGKENSYQIRPVSESIKINADWNKKIWNETKAEKLSNFMGEKPSPFPDVQVKARYDKKNIYVIFQVKDQYVRAVAKEIHGRVWEDSCVEFFFSPGPDITRGYFNLETNCKGIFLLGYTKSGSEERGLVDLSDCKKITIAHSLQKDTDTEITEPTTWYIEYSIPFEMLNKYTKVDQPAKGVKWKANFYKCADKTSHPHWLTWNKVLNPVPKFHLPEYFGTLEFQ